jgi:hypothetical protein
MKSHQRVILKGNISKFNDLPDDLTKNIYITFINESIKKYICVELQRLMFQLNSKIINVNPGTHYLISEDIIKIFNDEIFITDINFSFKVLIDILKNHYQTCFPLSLFIENVLLKNEKLINYLIENKSKNIRYFKQFEKIYNQYKNREKTFKYMFLTKSMAMSWIMYIYH